ncbi:MAG: pyrroline-5-carboxylate reductase dimerization domain-containing protein [Candidatus Falkowbacteria bacterium]
MNYGFIGFGNLGRALYLSFKDDKNLSFAYVSKNNKPKDIRPMKTIPSLVSFSDVIWLCVKPKDLASVLSELRTAGLGGKTIVSAVAGKNIASIRKYLGKDPELIRIMPNLAIAYKKSVTAFYADKKNSARAKNIGRVLSRSGRVIELPEKHFDLFTAVFGSGPAFLLEIMRVFGNKINELGIAKNDVNSLLADLVAGTLIHFQENQSEKSIADLINGIASKGGTTEAGLAYFKKKNLDKLLAGVITAAKNRSIKIRT